VQSLIFFTIDLKLALFFHFELRSVVV